MAKDLNFKDYVIPYLQGRPLFFSFIRPQEAYLFNKHKKYLQEPILDFGCGDGFFADVAFGKKSIAVGLDVEESRIEEARDTDVYQEIVKYEGYTIPFADNHFQTVVSNCVLEHIPDVEKCIAEIYRVLKPGGYFVTSVMADKWNDYMMGRRLLGKKYQVFMQKQQVHHNLWSHEKWTKTFESTGFNITSCEGYLSQNNSFWLDVAHYISIPSLVSHKFFNKWVLFPQRSKLPGLTKLIEKITMKQVDPKISSALFFVLKK